MLLTKDIVRDGHPALRKKSKEVNFPLTDEERNLLQKMTDYLKNSQDEEIAEKYDLRSGVGLAAPQLGVNKRLISIYFEHDGTLHDYQLVNPKIISHSVEQAYLVNGEGCLSVDEVIEGYVVRYHRVRVRAYDLDGNEMNLRLKGYPAIVIQHEIDHLNGIMFYDHINEANPFHAPENAVALE
ncbi:MAG TPA: peptide deformylase [Pseudogracilibacillus sp.]|nr:peptide deformylase [Pseudogracilibacillus sp.]